MSDLTGYYNRFDPSKNYTSHRFRAGFVLQSAELNEIQSEQHYRLKQIGDALFKDGDIVRDARITVDAATGAVTCESGAIYLSGAVRGVPAATLTIPVTGTVAIGIVLTATTITETEDPDLRDPAAETRNYNEPGASRLKEEPSWGFRLDDSDSEDFYPVYYIDDGVARAKEQPPQLDSVTQAIARYDRDSAGSNYVVSGLTVSKLADLVDGTQVYNVEAGRCRVNGFGVQLNTSVRLQYPAVADTRFIDSEPHTSTGTSAQRINVDRTPIDSIQQVRITKQTTETIVHGSYTGAADPLSNTSVISIVSVVQGGTTYVQGTDYTLTAGKVDWSPAGNEPAPGSSYSVTYQHIATVTPTAVDTTGFTVTDAVAGTLILTNYTFKLQRIDRLVLNEDGELGWLQGVSTEYTPVPPMPPSNLIALAQVVQTWDAGRYVVNDGVRTVPMSDIESIFARMDTLTDLVAQQKLAADASQRETSAQKGLFTDPFLDDSLRDNGIAQTAAIADGVLTLPIAGTSQIPSIALSNPVTCAFTLETILQQTARTGDMKINPYMAFGILPAGVQLNPSVDRWTDVETVWASPITKRFVSGWGNRSVISSSTTTLVKTTTKDIEYLRQIEVRFKLTGFGPGETLSSVKFDGLSVTPAPL